MTSGRRRAASLAVWGLLAAFGAIQVLAWTVGNSPSSRWEVAQVVLGWTVMLLLAAIATRRIGLLSTELTETENAHRATRSQVEQLQMHNAMLEMLARSVDVPMAFGSLAQRIARLVPCDRVGLALLSESGDEFHTYTARVTEQERRLRPRPEVVFKADMTAIGSVVSSGEPLIINDLAANTAGFIDISVIHSSGFKSALMMPLISEGTAVGTLNVVSRRTDAFTHGHAEALLPVTEIFAVAYVAQQLQIAVTRHRTVEAMTELMLSVSTEMNSALQTIIGHCDLVERGYPDPNLQRDMAMIVKQAQRISSLLDRIRVASHERLTETAGTVKRP